MTENSKTTGAAAGLWPLAQLGRRSADAIGGKAWGLARLQQAGLPVPPAVAVIGDAAAAAVDPAAVAAALGPGPYFVRSSFGVEDRVGHSFAGQGESLGHLDREAVPAAVQRVWDSWHREHAAAYRRRGGLGDERCGSVLIQREVAPVWSGVVFSHSPGAIGAWARIEAAKGYGEAVVGGRVQPQVVEVHVRTGATLTAVDDPELAAAVRALRRLLPRLVWAAGGAADAEWCLDSRGRVWLVQVRPAAPVAGPTIWSAALSNEFWSGRVSRLMFDTVGRAIEDAMLREPMRVVTGGEPPAMLRRAGQRVYVSATAIAGALPLIPPWSVTDTALKVFPPAMRARYEAERQAHAPWVPWELASSGVRFLRQRFPWPPLWQPLALRRLGRRGDRWLDRPVPDAPAALVAEVDGLVAALSGTLRWVVWGMVYAYMFAPLLDVLLGERAARPGAGALYADLPFDPVAALDADLRAFAARVPAALTAPDYATFRARLGDEDAAAFERLVARWGHRAEQRDLSAPRWCERPAALWQLLRLADAPTARADRHWLRWLLTQFPPWRGARNVMQLLAILPVAAMARLYLGYRERMRDLADRYLLALRRRLRALADREGIDDPWTLGWRPGRGFDDSPDPDRLDFGDTTPAFLIDDRPLDVASDGGALQGQGASPGLAEGRAVWVDEPADLEHFRPGDVLLAGYLDPSLSLALETAAAAAFRFGGMLSHGAIIAREYGVPAVVAVPGLEGVATGTRVRVDGVHGTVTVLGDG